MKKILLSALTLASFGTLLAQAPFFTKTCYRGAFAPAPQEMWTKDWTEWDPQNKVYPAPTVTVNANITTNTTWSAGQTVLLQGPIYVKGNSVLTIQAGVVIRASKAAAGSALIITKGSQLIANGTALAPIVFTSDQAPGSRSVGDWGGVILLGSAALNYTNGINNVEGLPVSVDTEFGGASTPNDNDNSGSLKYIRIEFGGYVYQPNKEINGLTMGAVGRGTTIEHIQTSFTNDDAFEWFGGTVNCKWLVSYRDLDDCFDTDNGYSGYVQFGLAVRDPNIADNPSVSTSEGFESDNDANGTLATPFTAAIFSNITLVGPLRGAITNTVASGYRRGARIRRNSNLKIFNSVFMDFLRGVHIDGTGCEGYATSGALKFKHNIIAGVLNGKTTEVNSGSTFNAPTWFGANFNDSIVSSANILNTPYNYTSPDYRPATGSPALSGASFTDAAIAPTSTNNAVVMASIPSSVCIGNSATITPYSFVASTTISSGYCSLTWSTSPGLSISSTTVENPTFTVSTIGTFSVFLTVNIGDGTQNVTQAIITNTCDNVSVKELNASVSKIQLFPNPSSEITNVTLFSANETEISLSLYDITGKQVMPTQNQKLNAGQNQLQIRTSELTNGIYFVTLNSAQGKETVKLVVQH